MRYKAGFILAGSMLGLAMPVKGLGAPIVEYNFGPNGAGFTYAATTIAPNVTASGINSTNDFGVDDQFSTDAGVGDTSGWYSNNPGGNYLSVSSNASASDDGFWIETIVTAAPGYVIDPSSFEVYGGAGGSSAVRSCYIFDNVDGFPTSITPNASNPPAIVGGDLLASGPFTVVRRDGRHPGHERIPGQQFFRRRRKSLQLYGASVFRYGRQRKQKY